MKKIMHFEAYVDFISTVLLCAPDSFPRRDWLKPSEQLNLERAFQVLKDHFSLVRDRVDDEARLAPMEAELAAALRAYQAGEVGNGAKRLQSFERMVLASGRH
jgi:hypothetical protein